MYLDGRRLTSVDTVLSPEQDAFVLILAASMASFRLL